MRNTCLAFVCLVIVVSALGCESGDATPIADGGVDAGAGGGGGGGAGGGADGGGPFVVLRRASRSSAIALDVSEQIVAALSPESDRLVTFPIGADEKSTLSKLGFASQKQRPQILNLATRARIVVRRFES